MDSGERVKPGDRLRLTSVLVQTVLKALQANEDHVVIEELTRTAPKDESDSAEIRLEVARANP